MARLCEARKSKLKAMDYDVLDTLLKKYVCQVLFEKLDGTQRRIVATNNMKVLESDIGQTILKYRRPTNGPMYDTRAKGNIICWDCQKMNFRTIKVANVIGVEDEIAPDEFIYMMKKLYGKLTTTDKMLHFMKHPMQHIPVFNKWTKSLNRLPHPDTIKWDS